MRDPVTLPPVHPGRTLATEIAARGLTSHALAMRLRVPATRIAEIVDGRRSITPETALRLGRCLGTGAEFWTTLQALYALALARERWGEIVDAEVKPAEQGREA